MRKIFFLFLAVFLIGCFFIWQNKNSHSKKKVSILDVKPTISQITPNNMQGETSLFIPYWTITNKTIDVNSYDTVIYFGIAPSEDGIDMQDDGYKNIGLFTSNISPEKKRLLAIRGINQQVNETILKDKSLQKKIEEEAINIAKKFDFSGIVLDFEVSALNFDNISRQITDFSNEFATVSHASSLAFFITAYGDNFYRARPYKIEAVEKSVDGVYVMAYDFHKAGGNPGPNFPFVSGVDENYNFQTMIDDFIKKIPPEKIHITFGMFGYDWKVGEKGQSITQATPLSLNEIMQKFVTNCIYIKCLVKKDSISQEPQVIYSDSRGDTHIVWFEDKDSATIKKKFLLSKGIYKIAFWAYSYF